MNLRIIFLIACLAISTSTLAHTGIKSTLPADDAVLETMPESLKLNFKGKVRLIKVDIKDETGEALDIGFKPVTDPGKSFSVELPELAPGAYTVSWSSMGRDSHKIKGDFNFSVAEKKAKKAESPLALVTVYKTPTCGCCAAWVDHMRDSGFTVETHDKENLDPYKLRAKLSPGLQSCHTAFVGDYAIEGHVPAKDVKRLLAEKPDISGLAAPGMPMVSPGMAPKGTEPSGYAVISYKDGEQTGAFSQY